MQSGILATVPIELWSHILKLALEATLVNSSSTLSSSMRSRASQSYIISLSSVCVAWRDSITQTTSFWSSLELEVTPTNIKACVGTLKLYLRGSGAKFSLGLCCRSFVSNGDNNPNGEFAATCVSPLGTIESLIFSNQCREKLSALTLRYPPEVWLVRLSSIGSFPLLVALVVDQTIRMPTSWPAPKPTGKLPGYAGPYPSLSQLDLRGIPFNSSLIHAVLSSTLTDVRYCSPPDSPGPWPMSLSAESFPSPSIVLSNVRTFQWLVSHPETSVFRHIQVPNAKRLEFSFHDTEYPRPSSQSLNIICPIIRSSQPLQKIALQSVTLSDFFWLPNLDSDLRQLLHAMEHVRRLEVQRWTGESLIRLAQLLSENDGQTENAEVSFIPHTRKLLLDLEKIRSKLLLSAVLESLAIMFEARFKRSFDGDGKFSLVIVFQRNEHLNDAFDAGMRNLSKIDDSKAKEAIRSVSSWTLVDT